MVEIKLSTLTKQVYDGLSLDELAIYYDLSRSQVASLLKEANLKTSRKGYRLVKDSEKPKDDCLRPKSAVVDTKDFTFVTEPDLFN
jgi:hypothetical protein